MTPGDLDALDRQIKANEGFRAYLYDDATGERITKGSTVIGHPTWGWGFNTDATDFTVEAAQAQYQVLRNRLISQILLSLPWTRNLRPGPFRVLVDIGYNAGFEGLIGFHKMLAALQVGDLAGAKREILNSQLAEGRKARLAALLLT